jgi:hypothetical protein
MGLHRPTRTRAEDRAVTIPTEAWVLPRPSRSKYPGSFPRYFEGKLYRLLELPDDAKILHPFGGCAERGDTCDLNASVSPTYVADAHDLSMIADASYDAVILDPPYSNDEAEFIYSIDTPLKRSVYTAEAVRVTKPGGYVVCYHVRQQPRPAGTRLVRRVAVLTRTEHSARVVMIFQKDEAAA